MIDQINHFLMSPAPWWAVILTWIVVASAASTCDRRHRDLEAHAEALQEHIDGGDHWSDHD